MNILQKFNKQIDSDLADILSISIYGIKKETNLEDILKEVEDIYTTHFPDCK